MARIIKTQDKTQPGMNVFFNQDQGLVSNLVSSIKTCIISSACTLGLFGAIAVGAQCLVLVPL